MNLTSLLYSIHIEWIFNILKDNDRQFPDKVMYTLMFLCLFIVNETRMMSYISIGSINKQTISQWPSRKQHRLRLTCQKLTTTLHECASVTKMCKVYQWSLPPRWYAFLGLVSAGWLVDWRLSRYPLHVHSSVQLKHLELTVPQLSIMIINNSTWSINNSTWSIVIH